MRVRRFVLCERGGAWTQSASAGRGTASSSDGIARDTASSWTSPTENKGEGSGVRPVELVLYGLAGCTAIDVVSILRKKREDVREIEIVVTGEQELDDFPHYYKHIELEYVVTGVGVKPESVARAIELSETKYCSVKGMFGPQVEVVTSFRVEETQPTGPERDS